MQCHIEFLWTSVLMVTFVSFVGCKKCMRNDDIGWRQGNIYFCDNPDLPECCEIDRTFTCCEPPPAKTLREQLQLWGTVVIFCIGLGIVYLYFKRDGGCCTSDTLAESCRSLRGKFTLNQRFHSMTEQYKENSESSVRLTSAEMHSDQANWQFKKKPLF